MGLWADEEIEELGKELDAAQARIASLERELEEANQERERLREAVRHAYKVFSDPNFTDRYDDAGRMKAAMDEYDAAEVEP